MIGSDAPCWNSYQMILKEYVQLFSDAGVQLDLSKIKEACSNTSEIEPEVFDPKSLPWFFYHIDKPYQERILTRCNENKELSFTQNMINLFED